MNPEGRFQQILQAKSNQHVELASAMDNFGNLNPQQLQGITTEETPVLMLAGAGSGKTRVVTSRIIYLLNKGVPPSKILAVTFTNKAAEVMRLRVQKQTQHSILICTFHSLGARILRESISALGYPRSFAIYDEDDVEKLIKLCLVELNLKGKKMEAKPFRYLISHAKQSLLNPEEVSTQDYSTDVEEAFPRVYSLYQKKLFEYHAVDFDDLLFLPVKLWKQYPEILAHYQHRWNFVLIDEYQDTNEAQYLMANFLVAEHRNLFVVGDPDQSIYSWRGANIQNILNFERDYPGARIIRLEQNYRSHMNILRAANALIKYNTNRYEKELWSELGEGEKITLFAGSDEQEEANFVAARIQEHMLQMSPLRDMVIFYRTNAQSRAFEDSFLHRGIPYVIVGGISFYQRREIKDILAFLRISQSGADYISFIRTVNLPKRGLGEATIEKIRHHATEAGMTILQFCETLIQDKEGQGLLRLTAKQKQGLQEYYQIIHELRQISKEGSIRNLVIAAIQNTRYIDYLSEDEESFEDRKENLDELIAKAVEWENYSPNPSLEAFLEELSLKSSLDDVDEEQDRINFMTIHNAKGLEFDIAFLVGLEENLFPHVNSLTNLEQIEEERRLCYVAITRAKKKLYVSYCQTRYLWGSLHRQNPSRFIKEIPEQFLKKYTRKQSDFFISERENKARPKISVVPHKKPQSSEIFAIGDRIFHQDFGVGEIQDAYEGSLGLTYKVFFDKNQSVKTLVAKYAILSRI